MLINSRQMSQLGGKHKKTPAMKIGGGGKKINFHRVSSTGRIISFIEPREKGRRSRKWDLKESSMMIIITIKARIFLSLFFASFLPSIPKWLSGDAVCFDCSQFFFYINTYFWNACTCFELFFFFILRVLLNVYSHKENCCTNIWIRKGFIYVVCVCVCLGIHNVTNCLRHE